MKRTKLRRKKSRASGYAANTPGGPEKDLSDTPTTFDQQRLSELLLKQTELPEDFHPHPKIKKFLESRRQMAAGGEPLDWAAGEALAFASLSVEGFRLRLSGQDSIDACTSVSAMPCSTIMKMASRSFHYAISAENKGRWISLTVRCRKRECLDLITAAFGLSRWIDLLGGAIRRFRQRRTSHRRSIYCQR